MGPLSTREDTDRVAQLSQTLKRLQIFQKDSVTVVNSLCTKLRGLADLTGLIKDRAQALTVANQNILSAKEASERLLEFLDTSRKVERRIEAGPAKDLDGFLAALSTLEAAFNFLDSHSNLAAARSALAHCRTVYDKGMQQCEADFAAVLSRGSAECEPPTSWLKQAAQMSVKELTELRHPMVPESSVPRLRALAAVMLGSHPESCMEVYRQLRRETLERVLRAAGGETPPAAALQGMPLEYLERRMQGWVEQLRLLVVLMLCEKQLADTIWDAPFNDMVYGEIISKSLNTTMQMGRDITDTKRLPEKLFVLLDMHTSLLEVVPLLRAVLAGRESTALLLNEALSLAGIVAKSARVVFNDFEDLVSRDAATKLPADGTVHPLCAYVLSFLKRLFTYPNAAEVLFRDTSGTSIRSPGGERMALGGAIARVLMVLLQSLEARAKTVKAPALMKLFLMNNVHYMVWTVEQSPMLGLLGQGWVERHKDLVERHGQAYHDTTWIPLVRLLHVDSAVDAITPLPKRVQAAKEKLKSFNTQFEQLYVQQSSWAVPEPGLKSAVKRFILQDMLPAYQTFLGAYQDLVQAQAQNPAKYLKYSVEDLTNMLQNDLLETKEVILPKRS